MNKLSQLLIAGFLVLMLSSVSTEAYAQGRGKGNNKGKKHKVEKRNEQGPPPWAPAHGYRAKTRYVYFKDHDVYYDNHEGVYITLSGSNWRVVSRIPDVLRKVDLKAAVKIDIDFDGDRVYQRHREHVKLYPKRRKH